jgi:hypothetical protein
MRPTAIISTLLAILLLSSVPAFAGPVNIQFSFSISGVYDNYGNPVSNPYGINIGDTAAVSLIYESSTPEYLSGIYYAAQSLTITVAGRLWAVDFSHLADGPYMVMTNNQGTNGDHWEVSLRSSVVDPAYIPYFAFSLNDPTGAVLSDSSLVDPRPLDQWDVRVLRFYLYDPSATISHQVAYLFEADKNSVTITTSVPEPSLLLLLGIGISGVLAFGWRKR